MTLDGGASKVGHDPDATRRWVLTTAIALLIGAGGVLVSLGYFRNQIEDNEEDIAQMQIDHRDRLADVLDVIAEQSSALVELRKTVEFMHSDFQEFRDSYDQDRLRREERLRQLLDRYEDRGYEGDYRENRRDRRPLFPGEGGSRSDGPMSVPPEVQRKASR